MAFSEKERARNQERWYFWKKSSQEDAGDNPGRFSARYRRPPGVVAARRFWARVTTDRLWLRRRATT